MMPMWKWELLGVAIIAVGWFLGWMWAMTRSRKVPVPVVPPKAVEPRKWIVPDIYAERLWELWTRWVKDGDFKARYLFWKEIGRILPETKDLRVRCHDSYALEIVIEERVDEDDEEEDAD